MKIFVTGATGFIGSQLVKELVSSRFEVVSIGRKAYEMLPAIKKEKLKGSTYLQIDMDEIEKLPKIISKNGISVQNDSVFFNLAWGGEKLLSDLNVKHQFRNVIRSENAMIAAKKIGIKKFIHVGTMEEAFAKKYDVLVIIVAHPTKMYKKEDGTIDEPTMYSIKGGGEWYDASYHGLLVHRNYEQKTVKVKVLKVKFQNLGENQAEAHFKWDHISGDYIPIEETNIEAMPWEVD